MTPSAHQRNNAAPATPSSHACSAGHAVTESNSAAAAKCANSSCGESGGSDSTATAADCATADSAPGAAAPLVVSLEPQALVDVAESCVTVARACGVTARGVQLHDWFIHGLRAISDAVGPTPGLAGAPPCRPPPCLFPASLHGGWPVHYDLVCRGRCSGPRAHPQACHYVIAHANDGVRCGLPCSRHQVQAACLSVFCCIDGVVRVLQRKRCSSWSGPTLRLTPATGCRKSYRCALLECERASADSVLTVSRARNCSRL